MSVIKTKASSSDLVKITESTLGSDAANITLSGIPTGYRDLVLAFKARSTNATFDNLRLRVGTGSIDTGAHYSYYTTWAISQNGSYNADADFGILTVNPGANRNAGIYGQGEITLYDYLSTSAWKMMIGHALYYERAVEAFADYTINIAWNQATAIDTLMIYPSVGPNLKAGSSVTLYGRK